MPTTCSESTRTLNRRRESTRGLARPRRVAVFSANALPTLSSSLLTDLLVWRSLKNFHVAPTLISASLARILTKTYVNEFGSNRTPRGRCSPHTRSAGPSRCVQAPRNSSRKAASERSWAGTSTSVPGRSASFADRTPEPTSEAVGQGRDEDGNSQAMNRFSRLGFGKPRHGARSRAAQALLHTLRRKSGVAASCVQTR